MVKNIEVEVMQVLEINEQTREDVEKFINSHVENKGRYLEFKHCSMIFPRNYIVKYKNNKIDVLCESSYLSLF